MIVLIPTGSIRFDLSRGLPALQVECRRELHGPNGVTDLGQIVWRYAEPPEAIEYQQRINEALLVLDAFEKGHLTLAEKASENSSQESPGHGLEDPVDEKSHAAPHDEPVKEPGQALAAENLDELAEHNADDIHPTEGQAGSPENSTPSTDCTDAEQTEVDTSQAFATASENDTDALHNRSLTVEEDARANQGTVEAKIELEAQEELEAASPDGEPVYELPGDQDVAEDREEHVTLITSSDSDRQMWQKVLAGEEI